MFNFQFPTVLCVMFLEVWGGSQVPVKEMAEDLGTRGKQGSRQGEKRCKLQ